MAQKFLLLILSVSGLFILSCTKNEDNDDNNNSQTVRISRAVYYYFQEQGTVITKFSYSGNRLSGYTSWHINNSNHDTLQILDTDISYGSGDTVILSTFRRDEQPEFSSRQIKSFKQGKLVSNLLWLNEINGPICTVFGYNDGRLITINSGFPTDSIFYDNNHRPDYRLQYYPFGQEQTIRVTDKAVFIHEGDKLSKVMDSTYYDGVFSFKKIEEYVYDSDGRLFTQGSGAAKMRFVYNQSGKVTNVYFGDDVRSANDTISFEYEPGEGNAELLFQRPLDDVYQLPFVVYAW